MLIKNLRGLTALLAVSGIALLLSALKPDSESQTRDCFVVVDKVYNKNCDNNYYVRWRNSCKEEMDIKYAFMTKNGNVMTGVSLEVDPGEIVGGSACNATGSVKTWSRPSSKSASIRFPTDEEIKKKW